MKKKSFGLAAAVAVLIVLGGSYALLANHNRIQESESAAAESETGVAVATIASDKVSSFQLADGDTSFYADKNRQQLDLCSGRDVSVIQRCCFRTGKYFHFPPGCA